MIIHDHQVNKRRRLKNKMIEVTVTFPKKKKKSLFLAMTLVPFIKSHFTKTLYTISLYQ